MSTLRLRYGKTAAWSGVRRVALVLGCVACAAAQMIASPVPGMRQPVDPQAAWLAYSAVDGRRVFPAGSAVPDTVLRLGDSPVETTAADELRRGFEGMLHRVLRFDTGAETSHDVHNLIVVGDEKEMVAWRPSLKSAKVLAPEGFRLRRIVDGKDSLLR